MNPAFGGTDEELRLADGRRLLLTRYGDLRGFPVLYCHGGLSSRLDVASAAPAARRAGVQIVAPDRPGIGGSDRRPRYQLLDWPGDVEQVADALGMPRFAVMGWSFGAAYATACAYALPDRVTRATLLASPIPRDWSGMIEQLNRLDRFLLRGSATAPVVDRQFLRLMRATTRHAPRVFLKQTLRSLDPQSRRAISRHPDAFVAATLAGLHDLDGVLDDYRIWNRPWGFALQELRSPVQVWHGRQDTLCPAQWAERLAGVIPDAALTVIPEAGHFVAHDHWPTILGELRSASPA